MVSQGIYSAGAGMINQMLVNDQMADNMANINTPGYKTGNSAFKSYYDSVINRQGDSSATPIGSMSGGSELYGTAINYTQGDLFSTGNPMDVGIQGAGFFAVKHTDASGAATTAYTRAGNFTRDAQGYMITQSGDRVQSATGGDILIPRTASKIGIMPNGDVQADNQTVGRMKIAQFANPQNMTRLGNSLYTTDQTPAAQLNGSVTVQQGMLEHSNANVITEMVNNLSGMRAYETMQKSIQIQNETLQKTVNDVMR